MQVIRFVLLVSGILLVLPQLQAQYRYGYFKVGVSGGSTNYLGDLDDDLTFRYTKAGFGLDASYRFNPFMSIRAGYFRGWARAADSMAITSEARNRRNLSFRTQIREFNAIVVFDFVPHDRGYNYRPPYVPYVFGGIGVFSFNPQALLGNTWYDLQPLGTEGQHLGEPQYPEPYALTQVSIPLGAGIRFALSPRWDLEIETGFRKTFTDYLDDVSGEYPDLTALAAQNEIAAQLSDRIDRNLYPQGAAAVNGIRGDRTQSDWYIYTAIRLSYIIDWVRCP